MGEERSASRTFCVKIADERPCGTSLWRRDGISLESGRTIDDVEDRGEGLFLDDLELVLGLDDGGLT
jgi:hypothetical protein